MYVKLYADILQSSIWAEDPETKIVWLTLLALSNQDGLVRATAPGIAHEARVPLEKTREALVLFESPDPDSRTPDNEGRRIERTDGGYLILNYLKYRGFRDDGDRRTKDRERQRRWYERHRKGNNPNVRLTPPNATSRQAEGEARKKTCAPPVRAGGFETFWKAYPKKRSKGAAEKAWKRLRPDADLLRAILAAIERGKASKDWQKEGGQYIPYAATWLRGRRWEDELDTQVLPASDTTEADERESLATIQEAYRELDPPPDDVERFLDATWARMLVRTEPVKVAFHDLERQARGAVRC